MLALDESFSNVKMTYVPKTTVEAIPAGAVVGGYTVDHFPLYVIDMGVFGHLDTRNNYAQALNHGNIPLKSTKWSYLVLQYREFLLNRQRMFDYPCPLIMLNNTGGSGRI